MTADLPDPVAPPASLRRQVLGGFAWLTAANAIRAVLRIAVLAVLGRLLSPQDFGLVAAAGVVLWLGNIFASLGVGPALVQREGLEPRHVRTGVTASLVFGVALGAVAYATAPAVADVFRMPLLTPVLRSLTVLFPVAALSVVGESLLQREMRFDAIARVELTSYATGYGAVGIALAFAGAGVWSLVGAELAKSVVKAWLLLAAAPAGLRPGFDGRALGELVRFGSGYTATSLSMYLALQGDNLVIARTLGPAALGLYGRAFELMSAPAKALGEVLHKILFSALSRVQGDRVRLTAAYRRGLALVALVVLPVSAATAVLAPEIVALLLGPRWAGAVPPLRILALAMYFQLGAMVAQSVTNAAGAVHGTAWRSAVYAALVVLGAAIGQRWGITGVAAGVVLAITVNYALITHLAGALTGVSRGALLDTHLPGACLAVATALASWGAAALLRSASAGPIATLAGGSVAALAGVVVLLRLLPQRSLGTDGLWLADAVSRGVPGPLGPLLRRALSLGPAE